MFFVYMRFLNCEFSVFKVLNSSVQCRTDKAPAGIFR